MDQESQYCWILTADSNYMERQGTKTAGHVWLERSRRGDRGDRPLLPTWQGPVRGSCRPVASRQLVGQPVAQTSGGLAPVDPWRECPAEPSRRKHAWPQARLCFRHELTGRTHGGRKDKLDFAPLPSLALWVILLRRETVGWPEPVS